MLSFICHRSIHCADRKTVYCLRWKKNFHNINNKSYIQTEQYIILKKHNWFEDVGILFVSNWLLAGGV